MRFPPPEVVASWPEPNYVDPERRGHASIVVQSLLLALGTALVFIRLYVKLAITRAGIELDDVLIVLSWVFAVGLTSSVLVAVQNYGWDVHIWDLPPSDSVTSRKISWASMMLYITTATLTKISILILYLRIIVDRVDRMITKMTLAAVLAYYLASFLVLLLQCRPLDYYWEILIPDAKGTCIDEGIHMTTTTTANLVLDIIIFAIPFRSLSSLKIRTTQKIHIVSLFSVGLFAIVSAAIRLVYVVIVTMKTYDVSWYGYLAWLMGAIEVHVSLICACIPSCRAFFVAWNRSSTAHSGSKDGSYPTGRGRNYNTLEDNSVVLTASKKMAPQD